MINNDDSKAIIIDPGYVTATFVIRIKSVRRLSVTLEKLGILQSHFQYVNNSYGDIPWFGLKEAKDYVERLYKANILTNKEGEN